MDAPACRAGVLAALAQVHQDAGRTLDPQAPLELDSLMVVALVDALENRFPIQLRAQDVTPQALASVDAVTALVLLRLGA